MLIDNATKMRSPGSGASVRGNAWPLSITTRSPSISTWRSKYSGCVRWRRPVTTPYSTAVQDQTISLFFCCHFICRNCKKGGHVGFLASEPLMHHVFRIREKKKINGSGRRSCSCGHGRSAARPAPPRTWSTAAGTSPGTTPRWWAPDEGSASSWGAGPHRPCCGTGSGS